MVVHQATNRNRVDTMRAVMQKMEQASHRCQDAFCPVFSLLLRADDILYCAVFQAELECQNARRELELAVETNRQLSVRNGLVLGDLQARERALADSQQALAENAQECQALKLQIQRLYVQRPVLCCLPRVAHVTINLTLAIFRCQDNEELRRQVDLLHVQSAEAVNVDVSSVVSRYDDLVRRLQQERDIEFSRLRQTLDSERSMHASEKQLLVEQLRAPLRTGVELANEEAVQASIGAALTSSGDAVDAEIAEAVRRELSAREEAWREERSELQSSWERRLADAVSAKQREVDSVVREAVEQSTSALREAHERVVEELSSHWSRERALLDAALTSSRDAVDAEIAEAVRRELSAREALWSKERAQHVQLWEEREKSWRQLSSDIRVSVAAENGRYDAELAESTVRLQSALRDIADLQSQVRVLESDKDALRSSLTAAQQATAVERVTLSQLRAQVSQQVAQTREMLEASHAQELADLRQRYLLSLGEARNAMADAAVDSKRKLESLRAEIDAKTAEWDSLRQHWLKVRVSYEQRLAHRESALRAGTRCVQCSLFDWSVHRCDVTISLLFHDSAFL